MLCFLEQTRQMDEARVQLPWSSPQDSLFLLGILETIWKLNPTVGCQWQFMILSWERCINVAVIPLGESIRNVGHIVTEFYVICVNTHTHTHTQKRISWMSRWFLMINRSKEVRTNDRCDKWGPGRSGTACVVVQLLTRFPEPGHTWIPAEVVFVVYPEGRGETGSHAFRNQSSVIAS